MLLGEDKPKQYSILLVGNCFSDTVVAKILRDRGTGIIKVRRLRYIDDLPVFLKGQNKFDLAIIPMISDMRKQVPRVEFKKFRYTRVGLNHGARPLQKSKIPFVFQSISEMHHDECLNIIGTMKPEGCVGAIYFGWDNTRSGLRALIKSFIQEGWGAYK